MNRYAFALLLILPALLPCAPAESRPRSPRPREYARDPADTPPRTPPPSDRYLRRLRRRDPDAFEKMRRLRRDDPAAFREALREKVMQRRQGRRAEHPHPLHREIQALRDADTEETRKQALETLREQLGHRIDQRHKHREERIEHIRRELRRLEERHREERENRDALVEQHLRRIQQRLRQTESPAPDRPERQTAPPALDSGTRDDS